ncbi:hypothetical protein A2U01_0094160, partial [Trifolium medium]|nr:hypothetical protein [Trifolium medium]
MLCATR